MISWGGSICYLTTKARPISLSEAIIVSKINSKLLDFFLLFMRFISNNLFLRRNSVDSISQLTLAPVAVGQWPNLWCLQSSWPVSCWLWQPPESVRILPLRFGVLDGPCLRIEPCYRYIWMNNDSCPPFGSVIPAAYQLIVYCLLTARSMRTNTQHGCTYILWRVNSQIDKNIKNL